MLGWDIGDMSGSFLPSEAQDLYQGDVWSSCWDGKHLIFCCCAKRRIKEGVSCSQCKYEIKPNFEVFLETCRDLRCFLFGTLTHGSTSQVSWTAPHFHKLPTSSRMKSFGIGMLRNLCHKWSPKWRFFGASHDFFASKTVTLQQVGGYVWILNPGEHDLA